MVVVVAGAVFTAGVAVVVEEVVVASGVVVTGGLGEFLEARILVGMKTPSALFSPAITSSSPTKMSAALPRPSVPKVILAE